MRPDRDDYINVLYENIGSYQGQFIKRTAGSIDSYGVPYDYASVMHYDSKVRIKLNFP